MKQLENQISSTLNKMSKLMEENKKGNEWKKKCENLEKQLNENQEKMKTLGDENKLQISKISSYEETLT